MKPRILFLCGRTLPDIGGVEIHVDKVARILANRGYDITVQTTTMEEMDLPYEVIRVQDTFIPRMEYSIIHCHDFYTYSDDLWGYTDMGKVYMTFHGWEGIYPLNPKTVEDRITINQKVCGSICAGKYIEKWYETPCDFNEWGGIDQGDIVPLDRIDPQRFIFIGGLRPDLELGLYLKILVRLKERGWTPHFDIVGGGSVKNEEAISGMIADYGIDVEMHGFMGKYNHLYEKANYVFAGGYLSMLKALANSKTTIAIWSNPLKRDYIEWYPGKLMSGGITKNDVLDNVVDDLAARIEEGFPPEITEGNRKWALSQTWDSVADIYEDLWAGSWPRPAARRSSAREGRWTRHASVALRRTCRCSRRSRGALRLRAVAITRGCWRSCRNAGAPRGRRILLLKERPANGHPGEDNP